MATSGMSMKFSTGNIIESNDDLLMKILLYLPQDILMRLKLVSKHWFSLISDSYFISLHFASKSGPPSALLFRSLCPLIDYYSISLINDHKRLIIKQAFWNSAWIHNSCNGLLLLSNKHRDIFVCNPTINQVEKLPPALDSVNYFEFLAYDPVKSSHYKVIAMRYDKSTFKSCSSCNKSSSYELCHVDIYSSKTGRWKHDIASMKVEGRDEFRFKTYWSGCLHWLTNTNIPHFDVFREKVGSLARPSAIPDGYTRDDLLFEYLGESMRRLYLIEVYRNNKNPSVLCIYEMRQIHSSGWNLVHQSCFDIVLDRFPEILSPQFSQRELSMYDDFDLKTCTLLSLVCGDTEDETFILLQMHSRDRGGIRVIRYNISKKPLQEFRLPKLKHYWENVSPYIETLANCQLTVDKLIHYCEDTYEESNQALRDEHVDRLFSTTQNMFKSLGVLNRLAIYDKQRK